MRVPFERVLVCAALFAALPALAQQGPPLAYMRSICTKVNPGKGQELEKLLAATAWKAADNQVKSGKLARYASSRVVMPLGEAAECDYISSYTYTAFPPEPTQEAATAAYAAAGVDYADFISKLRSLSRTVSTAYWAVRDSTGTSATGDYFGVARVKYDSLPAVLNTYNRLLKPVGEVALKGGARKGSGFYTKIMPTGSAEKYNAAFVTVYGSWDAYAKPAGPLGDRLKQAGLSLTAQEYIEARDKASKLVETSLYKIIYTTGSVVKK